jgi:hypothetical protein
VQIKARMSMSIDGYVATTDGMPTLVSACRFRSRPVSRLSGVHRRLRCGGHGPADVPAGLGLPALAVG